MSVISFNHVEMKIAKHVRHIIWDNFNCSQIPFRESTDAPRIPNAAMPRRLGHGAWAVENSKELLKSFEEAVLRYGRELAIGENVDVILEHLGPKDVVFIERYEEHGELKVGRGQVATASCCNAETIGFEVDGFPGASLIHPMGKEQWLPPLAGWVFQAAFRLSSITTVVVLDIGILQTLRWQKWPLWSEDFFRVNFLVISVMALALEILAATWRAWQAHRKSHCTGVHFIQAMVASSMLRFFGMPHPLLNAPTDSFSAGKRLQPNFQTPVLLNVSRSAKEYERCSGTFSMLPKIFLEDVVMAIVKILLLVAEQKGSGVSMALIICTIQAGFGSLVSLHQLRSYVAAFINFDSDLLAHAETDDPFDMKGRPRTCGKTGGNIWVRNSKMC